MNKIEPLQPKNITLPKDLIDDITDLVAFVKGLGFECNFSSIARSCISRGLLEVSNHYEQFGILNGKIKMEEIE